MSGSLALPAFAAAIISDLFIKYRAIGIILPDVTIEESLHHELTITEHPVEYNAPITDHAYRRQYEVSARYGWDNSIVPSMTSLVGAALGRNAVPSLSFTKIKDIFAQLTDLQESRIPFLLSTGKRNYPNMLIASLTVPTDSRTENALMASCIFREVLIVKTRSVVVGPVSAQTTPAKTADVVDKGTAAAQPVSTAPFLETGAPVPGSLGLTA